MAHTVRIGSLVDGTLKRLGVAARCREQQAILIWPEVVGEANARRSWPERVQDGVLSVVAASPAWAQELALLKGQIMERLRERLGADIIKDIRFSAGRRHLPRRAREPKGARPRRPSLAELAVDREVAAQIDGLVTEIDEPELRERVHKALLRLARVRAWRVRHGWRRCESCGGLHRARGKTCPVCHGESRHRGWQRLRLAMKRKR